MKPYYESNGITIYHGDCLDVLSGLEVVADAVITDPPYASGGRTEAARGNGKGSVSNRQRENGAARESVRFSSMLRSRNFVGRPGSFTVPRASRISSSLELST